MARYTRRQCITLFVVSLAQFCNALCFSIQAPFYPSEAESKGATPSQYGFVFGVYQLVVFICCPLYGKFLGNLGVKFVNNAGIIVLSVTCLLFGFLSKINDVSTFIGFSFAIRIIEATGTSAFITAAFSIIAQEFEDVGSAFAILETFFGFGLIVGPTLGGALYEVGGFLLPFLVVGVALMICGLLIFCLLPPQRDVVVSQDSKGMLSLLTKAPFIIGTLVIIGTSYSIGFVQAILEPHIRKLDLSPLQVGLLFIVNGTTYAISAPVWGRLSDRVFRPQVATTCGSFFIVVAFLLMGPAPFLPLNISLPILITSLVLHGLGMGACLVGSFSGFHKDALKIGLPDDITTYGMVSGLWTSTFAFGAFVGPSAAGLLFDHVGFAWASQTIVVFHILLFLFSVSYQLLKRLSKTSVDRNEEEQNLLGSTNTYGSC